MNRINPESCMLLSSWASSRLANKLSQSLWGRFLARELERDTFPGGESYYRIPVEDNTELLGTDVIYVGSSHNDLDLLELYRVGCALAGYGTRRRVFVVPFMGYSTMERAVKPGEVVVAKTVARMLSGIPNTGPGNVFLFVDLHSSGILHYFEGDCLRYEMTTESLLIKEIADLQLDNFVMGSADLGRTKSIERMAAHFGVDLVLVRKERHNGKPEIKAVIGEAKGKTVVIYDDMVRSANSLIASAEIYRECGADRVIAVISHFAVADHTTIDRLADSPIDQLITTDSHPMSNLTLTAKFKVIPIAPVIARTIEPILGTRSE